jgi:hypothetical protein
MTASGCIDGLGSFLVCLSESAAAKLHFFGFNKFELSYGGDHLTCHTDIILFAITQAS